MDALPPRNVWRVRREIAFPAHPCAEGLVEDGVDALPVRVLIDQDRWVTGWDDGAMGFEEDAVWFSGEATSFRIVAPDVRSRLFDRVEASRMSVPKLLKHGLPLRHPWRDLRIRVAVVEAQGRWRGDDEERLAAEIRRLWLLGAARHASQYPPLLPRPGADVLSFEEWLRIEEARQRFLETWSRRLWADARSSLWRRACRQAEELCRLLIEEESA